MLNGENVNVMLELCIMIVCISGMHCVDCGYNCHEKCMTSVPKNCTKLKTVTDNSTSSSSISRPSESSSVGGDNRMCKYFNMWVYEVECTVVQMCYLF